MTRNPTYLRRRQDRLRLEDAQRSMKAQRERALMQAGSQMASAIEEGMRLLRLQIADSAPPFTSPPSSTAH